MPDPLDRFFAVTATSLYVVSAERDENDCPIVEKIALRRDAHSKIPVGARLTGGYRVGINPKYINLYDDRPQSLERGANKPPWGDQTSPLVALFLNENEARACLDAEDPQLLDPRWRAQTVDVLRAIGDDHPVFFVARPVDGLDNEMAFPYTFFQPE